MHYSLRGTWLYAFYAFIWYGMMTGHDDMTDHDMTDEIEIETGGDKKIIAKNEQYRLPQKKGKRSEADAYSLLAKIQKRRKEIEKEIIALDSAFGLDSGSQVFFRNRRSNGKH
jgi:hypothetical protein